MSAEPRRNLCSSYAKRVIRFDYFYSQNVHRQSANSTQIAVYACRWREVSNLVQNCASIIIILYLEVIIFFNT